VAGTCFQSLELLYDWWGTNLMRIPGFRYLRVIQRVWPERSYAHGHLSRPGASNLSTNEA